MRYSLTKHFKYKLEARYVVKTSITGYSFRTKYISMFPDGRFSIHESYSWDGSSVPFKKMFRIITLGWYDADKYCKEASLVHDALCQTMREGVISRSLKPYADGLYYEMCIASGMSERQAARRYKALRKFGDVGIRPEDNPRNTVYTTQSL